MVTPVHVEKFTPGEAEATLGINVVLHSKPRRRFPEWHHKGAGQPRFTLFECLQLSFVHTASKYNIGPSKTYAPGEWVAHYALHYALRQPGCVDGPSEEVTLDGIYVKEFDRPRIRPTIYAFLWSDGSDWFDNSLSNCLKNLKGGDPREGDPVLTIHSPSFAKK